MSKKKKKAASSSILVQGILKMNPRGFGFVTEIEDYPDVFIAKTALETAVDGDRVEVHVTCENRDGKGPEGRVSQVLDRARKHLALIITETKSKTKSNGYSHILGQHRQIEIYTGAKQELKAGD